MRFWTAIVSAASGTLLGALCSCARPSLDLDFGDRTTASGMLLTQDEEGVSSAVFLELRDAQVLPKDFTFDVDANAPLTWLVGSYSASSAGWQLGAVAFTESGPSYSFPYFDEAWSRSPSGDFERLPRVPDSVARLRIAAPPPKPSSSACAQPEVRRVDSAPNSSKLRLLPFGDRVLIVTERRALHTLNRRLEVNVALRINSPELRAGLVVDYDAPTSAGNEVWSVSGSCMERIVTSTTDIFSLENEQSICASGTIFNARSFDGTQFLASTAAGYELIAANVAPIRVNGILSAEPRVAGPDGRYWLLDSSAQSIFFLASDGSWTSERVPLIGQYVSTIDFVPGYGLLVGDSDGNIYQHNQSGWIHLGAPDGLPAVSAFAAVPGGFLSAGGTTVLARYAPTVGFCSYPFGSGSFAAPRREYEGITSIAPLGEGLVFATTHPDASTTSITWVRFVD